MMRKAVFKYKDFLEEKRKELGLDVLDNEQRLKDANGVQEQPSAS